MTIKRIAVIGGGASAAILLCHLARDAGAKDLSVDIYDRTGRFGRGIAYSTSDISHLLNVRAANMSVFAEEKDDFLKWLSQNGYDYGPLDFVPRKIFGDYLTDRMNEAANILNVRFVQADKIDAGGYDVSVLATGNVRSIAPPVKGSDVYYADPYHAPYDAIPKDGHVVILGTGLSAADTVLSLQAHDFTGTITMISRKGWLPRKHAAPESCEPWMQGEHIKSPSRMMTAIRAQAKTTLWCAVIDAMRPDMQRIWQGWSEQQRATFMRHGFSLWNIHRHRMAPQVLETIESREDLHIVKDRILRIEGRNVVCTRGAVEDADAIINCLGYRYDEAGREYESATYKIGPARFGPELETTAIPEIRAQAAEIAQLILGV